MKVLNIRKIILFGVGTLAAFGITAMAGAVYAQSITPAQTLEHYRAAVANSKYIPSPQQGEALFRRTFKSTSFTACTACHASSPMSEGKHAVTGKTIRPLAPAANAKRLTDLEKTEKWFRRNCTEVLGRECSNIEKADFVSYLIGVR